jgi:hypothetical protein
VTDVASPPTLSVDILVLDAALDDLAPFSSLQVRVVELRFFAGLEFPAIPDLLGVSSRTAATDSVSIAAGKVPN